MVEERCDSTVVDDFLNGLLSSEDRGCTVVLSICVVGFSVVWEIVSLSAQSFCARFRD
jgi:hypothetical protein